MNETQNIQNQNEEELAMLKMRNLEFPSLSNKNNKKEEKEFEFVFDDVTPVYRNNELVKYQMVASAATLGRLWDEGTIIYEGSVQRGYKQNKKGEEVAVFSNKHVKEILESILSQKFHGNFITLNALDSTPIEFNEEERTLTILPNQKLQVLDGQHRLRSFSQWLKLWRKKKELYISPEDFYITLVVETLSKEKAKSLFSEYSTKPLKISASRSLFLDIESNINRIARKVMNESELKNKVEVVSNTVKKSSNKLISFSVLMNGIKNNYKPQTIKEADQIADHLINFFNELVNQFPEAMGDIPPEQRQESKTKSFSIEVLAFHAYFALSLEFFNAKGWEKKLKKLKDTVKVGDWEGEFLSKDNPLWRSVMRENNRIINTSSTIKYMEKFIVGYVALDKSIEELLAEK